MTSEQLPPRPAAEFLRDELLDLFESLRTGLLSIEDFVAEVETLLNDLPLYPTTAIMTLGAVVGEKLEKSPGLAVDLTMRIVSSVAREVRALAAVVIHRLARFQPGMWVDTTRHLATDDDWEVRDLAARVFDSQGEDEGAAEFHLTFVHETVKAWAADSDYLVRRAATQALTGYALRHTDFRPLLLDLLRPLLDDEREYVRRGVAAALRKLGKADPPTIFEFFELMTITPRSSQVIRLTLEHPFAGRFPDRKSALMAHLTDADLPDEPSGEPGE
jgi:3-methyladenine DNA glycosylase AlkD